MQKREQLELALKRRFFLQFWNTVLVCRPEKLNKEESISHKGVGEENPAEFLISFKWNLKAANIPVVHSARRGEE